MFKLHNTLSDQFDQISPPPFVKNVLAPQNGFGMPKITWSNYKSFGIVVGKNSQIILFSLRTPLILVENGKQLLEI